MKNQHTSKTIKMSTHAMTTRGTKRTRTQFYSECTWVPGSNNGHTAGREVDSWMSGECGEDSEEDEAPNEMDLAFIAEDDSDEEMPDLAEDDEGTMDMLEAAEPMEMVDTPRNRWLTSKYTRLLGEEGFRELVRDFPGMCGLTWKRA